MKKVIVFDLDGTLVDTIYDISSSMNKSLEEYGFSTHQIIDYINFIGEGVIALGKKAIGKEVSEETLNSVIDRYKKIYKANLTNLSKPYACMDEVLDQLLNKGYKLAVISNKPHEDTLEIINYYFPNKFTYIAGAKDNVLRKPDPMAMKILLEELNVKIEDVSYVGDSRYDAMFSINCGCDYYLFTYGYTQQDVLNKYSPIAFLDTPNDLLKYF